jgi:hypothetical protein
MKRLEGGMEKKKDGKWINERGGSKENKRTKRKAAQN